ncbi:hypothetical protein CNY89_29010, partial [Amaricoccus sp. HAR-UPW-R2A-40]
RAGRDPGGQTRRRPRPGGDRAGRQGRLLARLRAADVSHRRDDAARPHPGRAGRDPGGQTRRRPRPGGDRAGRQGRLLARLR